jgi:hypothetical protein
MSAQVFDRFPYYPSCTAAVPRATCSRVHERRLFVGNTHEITPHEFVTDTLLPTDALDRICRRLLPNGRTWAPPAPQTARMGLGSTCG